MTFSVLGGGSSRYNIDRSLRFRSSASAYLSRTFGTPTAQNTWTVSLWMKIGTVGARMQPFSAGVANRLEFEITAAGYFNIGDAATTFARTNMLFRDPSAWYHVVVRANGSGSALTVYVNGVQQTLAVSNNLTTSYWNSSGTVHYIGCFTGPTYFFDGYLAEVNFIDGQALTPTAFGAFDPVTGVWNPKKYTGTYGTNGFYLDFKDNTSATTLAYDKSGNGNNWTANNISTTAGATYDSMTDVPTLTSASASNYCTLNPNTQYNLDGYLTAVICSNGNLKATGSASQGTSSMGQSTFAVSTGKYYCEMTVLSINSANNIVFFVGAPSGWGVGSYWGFYRSGGSGQGIIGTPATYTTNDVIGLAFDAGAGSFTFYKNGVQQCVSDPAWYLAGSITNIKVQLNATADSVAFNFGQRPFSYTPPTGFKALNTFNLPDPVIKKPNQYMDATTYSGNGTTQSIVNAAGFQPDLVWAKCRSSPSDHALYDSVRGIYQDLASSTTGAESTQTTGLTSFNTNGFTTGAYSKLNASGPTYVGWQWKKGATPGFDIVTYTGTGAVQNISHNLGVAPKFIVSKSRSTAGTNWNTYHVGTGATNIVYLNSAAATTSQPNVWNSTAPTSSVFTVGTDADSNGSGRTFVAYLFAEIPGFSKFGSYTGNGSSDGPFVYTGFRPKYVMVKRTDTGGFNWEVWDSSRNLYNPTDATLMPNTSDAEFSGYDKFDYLSNGFKARIADRAMNTNGGTYIYAAFAENPFKYSLAR